MVRTIASSAGGTGIADRRVLRMRSNEAKRSSARRAESVTGVFAGSGAWWIILCAGAWALRRHFDFKRLVLVHRATGVLVIAVGLVYLFLRTSADHAPTIPIPERLRAHTPTATPS